VAVIAKLDFFAHKLPWVGFGLIATVEAGHAASFSAVYQSAWHTVQVQ
jgi:hypothetical protein